MGFFDEPEDNSNSLMQQQIRQNEIEIATKRDNLYKQRLDIVKTQGAPSWISSALPTPSKPRKDPRFA